MKKVLSIGLVLVLVSSFVLVEKGKADAMNNESAAMLAGAIALVGGVVIHAAARDAYYPEPVYVETYPAVYYGDRTQFVYEYPRYVNAGRHCGNYYERGRHRERHYFNGGRHDGRRRY